MANVQIAVRLWWKARLHNRVAILLRAHILGNLIAQKVGDRPYFLAFLVSVRHGCNS